MLTVFAKFKLFTSFEGLKPDNPTIEFLAPCLRLSVPVG